MSPVVPAHPLGLALGAASVTGAQPSSPLVSACEWLLVSVIATLAFWALTLGIFRRRAKRRPAHRGLLFVALFLVVLAGSNLAIADTFASSAPMFFLPIAGFFLLFFYLFSDSQYAPTWTRWLVFLYGVTQVGTLGPSKPPSPQASQLMAQFPLLFGMLAVVGDVGLVILIVLGVVPQIYYRYRRFVETGGASTLEQWNRPVGGAALAAASFLELTAAALLAQPSPRTPSAVVLCARTSFFLLATLLPVAGGFALARGQRFDRDAVVNRVLSYSALCLSLLLVYIVTIGLQLVFVGPPAVPLIFVYILLVAPLMAGLFRPLRAWIQDAVDQRFFRRRYDAARVLVALGGSLHEETHLDLLSRRLVIGIQKAFDLDAVTLWLRSSSGLAPAQRGRGFLVGAQAAPSVVRQSYPEQPADDTLRLHRQAGAVAAGPSAALTAVDIALDEPSRQALLWAPAGVAVGALPADAPLAQAGRADGAALALPLVAGGELIGVIALGTPPDAIPYTIDERELLAGIASAASPLLRVAQWEHEQSVQARERERVEQELQTARRIQEALLPKAVPTLDGWQLATLYQPAREVGGDFYDFLTLPDGRLGIVLGDVTDKGMPAALVMATTRSMLRAVATQQSVSPGRALAHVNELLCPDLPDSMFVTCFYAILDPATGQMRFANAGQDLPYVRHADGDVCELRARGMPLGLMPGMSYEEHDVLLAPGESILFYSDGLVEAHDPQREMFGFPRLMSLLGGHTDATPPIVFLLRELADFTGAEWEQEDDITLVSLLRLEQTAGDQTSERDADADSDRSDSPAPSTMKA